MFHPGQYSSGRVSRWPFVEGWNAETQSWAGRRRSICLPIWKYIVCIILFYCINYFDDFCILRQKCCPLVLILLYEMKAFIRIATCCCYHGRIASQNPGERSSYERSFVQKVLKNRRYFSTNVKKKIFGFVARGGTEKFKRFFGENYSQRVPFLPPKCSTWLELEGEV